MNILRGFCVKNLRGFSKIRREFLREFLREFPRGFFVREYSVKNRGLVFDIGKRPENDMLLWRGLA